MCRFEPEFRDSFIHCIRYLGFGDDPVASASSDVTRMQDLLAQKIRRLSTHKSNLQTTSKYVKLTKLSRVAEKGLKERLIRS